MKPLLLLDVDGPLNPFGAKPERRPVGYTTHRLVLDGWTERRPLRVWLNPDHGRKLTELAAEFSLELAWATTWQHDANRLIGQLIGLPVLPVIEFGNALRTSAWKWNAVSAYAEDRPLAWLDDDFHNWRDGRAAFDIVRADKPTLLRTVDRSIGMTDADLDAVATWAMGLVMPDALPEAEPDALADAAPAVIEHVGLDEDWVGVLHDINAELDQDGWVARA